MKEILINWTFFRAIRLGLGIMMLIQAFMVNDLFLGIAAALFSIMALFNTGCCSVNSCPSPKAKSTNNSTEIVYEEVINPK